MSTGYEDRRTRQHGWCTERFLSPFLKKLAFEACVFWLALLFFSLVRSAVSCALWGPWPFDERAAQRRQLECARDLPGPVFLHIPIPEAADMEMVLIPPGDFMMGSPRGETGRESEERLHRVRITKPFYIGRHEVTRAQYASVLGKHGEPYEFVERRGRWPATDICHADVQAVFLPAMRPLAPQGWHFALPTEAQWEYACRAGSEKPFGIPGDPEGAKMVRAGEGLSAGRLVPVGSRGLQNVWGLHDMHGNAAEYCRDMYFAGAYRGSTEQQVMEDPFYDPADALPAGCRDHFQAVVRGGALGTPRRRWRSAARMRYSNRSGHVSFGFRVVLVRDE